MSNRWQQLISDATALRHDLHRKPELTWQEFETAGTIRQRLDASGIGWRPCAETGTVATIAADAAGRHVALRADIDALPMLEATGLPYQSTTPGLMHACGHDGHTATLMAAGQWLKQHEADLPGPVTLLFQPAEEGGHGAKRMIEDGALDGVDVVFGWHNWPSIKRGKAICPDGPVMGANGTFEITVQGSGGHASQPERVRDPIAAASAIVLALQQIVSRRLPPQTPAVVSVTSFDAVSNGTIIPGQAKLIGSIRASKTETREQVSEMIGEIAQHTAHAWQTKAVYEWYPRYGATVNHAKPAQEFRDSLSIVLGEDWQCESTAVPIMASEDFSYYLMERPGAFAIIGADDNPDTAPPCHNTQYDFNDELIPVVVKLYLMLAGCGLPTG